MDARYYNGDDTRDELTEPDPPDCPECCVRRDMACEPGCGCEYCRRREQDREPPEPDGEAFRGGEAAAYEAEQQAHIQRTLK